MIAILEAHRAGLLGRAHWARNIVSGIVVGVVALPLAMAFAIASGAKPEQGLYTAIVAGLLVSMFGGSRLQIAGPTGAFIVILLSGITAEHGIDGLQISRHPLLGMLVAALGIAISAPSSKSASIRGSAHRRTCRGQPGSCSRTSFRTLEERPSIPIEVLCC